MPKFVFLVNENGYEKYTYEAAKAAGASVPMIAAIRKIFEIHNAEPLNRYFELPFKSFWFSKVVDESKFDSEDDIFFILYESFHMTYSRKFIKHYRNRYRNAKFLYFFTNPANDYNLRRINKIKYLLDGVFSFNKEDVEEYGYIYVEDGPFVLPRQRSYEPITDVFFIGANKGRLPILIDVYEKLSSYGMVCDFWITDVPEEMQKYSDIIHYNKSLTYDEVLQHDARTRCILEILQQGKSYSSIRTTEALQYHKKVLTMSDTVKEEWFYDPHIIQVFHSTDDIDIEFIREDIDEKKYANLKIGSFERFEEFIVRAMQKIQNSNHSKKSLPELYSGGVLTVIKSDLARLCEPTLFNALKFYILSRGTVFPFDVWFRILQWSRLTKTRRIIIGPIVYLIHRHYEYKYGIHANANIYVGRGLHIMHGDGVHLNCEYIGENFTVFQGVTLGAKHGEKPTVLDNVTVYTNSVICGGVTLHDGCTVGAQSYVDKDVSAGCFVAGVPAKIIKKG